MLNDLNDHQKRIIREYRECGIKHVELKFGYNQKQVDKLLEPELKLEKKIMDIVAGDFSQFLDNYHGDPQMETAKGMALATVRKIMKVLR